MTFAPLRRHAEGDEFRTWREFCVPPNGRTGGCPITWGQSISRRWPGMDFEPFGGCSRAGVERGA
jgi:hypothetical protein